MENNTNGLIFAFLLDGHGGAEPLSWQQIDEWKPEKGVLWVHCEYSNPDARDWLINKSGLDSLNAKALTVEESRPSSVVVDKGLLLFIRAVNTNPGQDPEDMVSLRMWVDKNRLITTRKRRLLSVQDVGEQLRKGCGPKDSVDLMLAINNRILDRISDVIDEVDDKSDDLEEQVITIESRTLRSYISDIRREAILLRRYLAPQREALFRLYADETGLLGKAARFRLREMSDRLIRYVEDLDSARDRAAIIQEELVSRISEQMDRRMYVLSMVAVIFLPLSFITGLLGINVGGIPGAEHKGAFWWVCAGLLFITGLMLLCFKKKKWI